MSGPKISIVPADAEKVRQTVERATNNTLAIFFMFFLLLLILNLILGAFLKLFNKLDIDKLVIKCFFLYCCIFASLYFPLLY